MSVSNISNSIASVLLIEPFYGGSHKCLMDLLLGELGARAVLYSAPDKKWHWRARTAALYFAQEIPGTHNFQVIFASSVLNLAELISLRPDLQKCRKVLYFHENQLIYPTQDDKERDFQYGYNQILSGLVADVVVFNSHFNMNSFLDNLDSFIKHIPSARPKHSLSVKIRPKCCVLYFPLSLFMNPLEKGIFIRRSIRILKQPCLFCRMTSHNGIKKDLLSSRKPLHIVWPHRWEHDKDPDFFVTVLEDLRELKADFVISVVGQQFSEIPDSLLHASRILSGHIRHWGFLNSKEDYYKLLKEADVVVSTAVHEFFGVAMLEAVNFGCYPLVPRRLVYPEFYPDECLYNPDDTKNLRSILQKFCADPEILREKVLKLDVKKFYWSTLKGQYLDLLAT